MGTGTNCRPFLKQNVGGPLRHACKHEELVAPQLQRRPKKSPDVAGRFGDKTHAHTQAQVHPGTGVGKGTTQAHYMLSALCCALSSSMDARKRSWRKPCPRTDATANEITEARVNALRWR